MLVGLSKNNILLILCSLFLIAGCSGPFSDQSEKVIDDFSNAFELELIRSGVCSGPQSCHKGEYVYLDGGGSSIYINVYGVKDVSVCKDILSRMFAKKAEWNSPLYLRVAFFPLPKERYVGLFGKSKKEIFSMEVELK